MAQTPGLMNRTSAYKVSLHTYEGRYLFKKNKQKHTHTNNNKPPQNKTKKTKISQKRVVKSLANVSVLWHILVSAPEK